MNNLDIKNYIIAWKEIIFHSNNKPFHHNLFYKNNANWMILLFIADATYNNENISYEKLCTVISQNASKSTIYRILNNFLLARLIIKKYSTTDSRVKYFYLSKTGKVIFEDLVKIELELFASIKKK